MTTAALTTQPLAAPVQHRPAASRLPRRAAVLRSAAARREGLSSAQESKNMLEAFFVGKALAETLNERLGAALGDALAEFGKWDAETRQAIREFQEEVLARAEREMRAAAGADTSAGSSSSSGGSGGSAGGSASGTSPGLGGAAATPDLPALVDELRAEVAATRAVLQQLKNKQQQQGGGQAAQRP